MEGSGITMTARSPVSNADKVVETWVMASPGTCYVWTYDKREDKYIKQRVGGRQGSKTLHISTDDRRFNQEQIVDEMKSHDPFTNGMLILTSKERAEDIDSTYHLTAEDLKEIFKVEDRNAFEQQIRDTKSELVLRRMLSVGEKAGTVAQLAFIKEIVDERYKVGGTQRTVEEMIAAGEDMASTHLT